MPIERSSVGRRYTKRDGVDVLGDNLRSAEGAEVLRREFAAMATTVTARIEQPVTWARSVLEGAGLPHDVNYPPYTDRAWQRANERKSPEWYAIKILDAERWLQTALNRGDAELAASYGLDLGTLATEARFIGYQTGNAAKGGQGFAGTSDKISDVQIQREQWRAEATQLLEKHPRWSTRRLARSIDPLREESVRKAIANLKN